MDHPFAGDPDHVALWQTSWDHITELDKLPNFRNIMASFESSARDWREWVRSAEPETVAARLPGAPLPLPPHDGVSGCMVDRYGHVPIIALITFIITRGRRVGEPLLRDAAPHHRPLPPP